MLTMKYIACNRQSWFKSGNNIELKVKKNNDKSWEKKICNDKRRFPLKQGVSFVKSQTMITNMQVRSDAMKPKSFWIQIQLNWDSQQGRDFATSGDYKKFFDGTNIIFMLWGKSGNIKFELKTTYLGFILIIAIIRIGFSVEDVVRTLQTRIYFKISTLWIGFSKQCFAWSLLDRLVTVIVFIFFEQTGYNLWMSHIF